MKAQTRLAPMMISILHQYSVRHLRMSPAVCLREDQPVREAIAQMQAHRIGCVLVCRDERLTGIVTEVDILRNVEGRGLPVETPISAVMTPSPACVNAETSIWEAARTMKEGGFRHLPVVGDRGEPQGFVSIRSLVTYLADQFPETIYTLPPDPDHLPRTPEGP